MSNFFAGMPLLPKSLVIVGGQNKMHQNHILEPTVYGSSGYRLWKMMMHGNHIDKSPDHFNRSDFVWCCRFEFLCEGEWDEAKAAEKARELLRKELRPMLLLGSRVVRAFFQDRYRAHPLPWHSGNFFAISNPSGDNRAYESGHHYRENADCAASALSYALRSMGEKQGYVFAQDVEAS